MTVPTIPEPPAPSPFLDLTHERLARRAEPRASIALAGAGCVLAILGVLVLATDRGAGDGGSFNRWPGLIMSVIVIAAGMTLLEVIRRGPVATAGAVGAALGVPAALLFLTIRETSLPPYSTNAILLGSTAVWAATYAMGPGRGRPFFLGAAALGLWASLLQLSEQIFDLPFRLGGVFASSLTDTSTGTVGLATGEALRGSSGPIDQPVFHTPDATTIGLISLGIGVVFLGASRWLDRTGRRGAATPLLVAAIPALIVGATALGDDLESTGTGLLLGMVGAAMLLHGTTSVRRATTWIGGAVATVGLAVILTDATDDATVGGTLFLLGGIALVAVAYLYASFTSEPDELLVVPPRWRIRPEGPRRQIQPEVPAADPVAEAETTDGDDDGWAPPPAPS